MASASGKGRIAGMTDTTNAAPQLLARLERIPTAWWHVRARMILGVATFFDAFNLLAISFALPAFVFATETRGQGQILEELSS
jgi:putative MFS transporter